LSIGAITGSGSTSNLIDAIKALRAGNVAATQSVSNRFDPRDNTQVEEQSSAQQRQQAAETKAGPQQQQPFNARGEQGSDATPRQSSTFLTQALAQEHTASTSESVSTTTAGATAYANSAYSDAASRASALSGKSRSVEYEILSPNPSASSGRGVDLSV